MYILHVFLALLFHLQCAKYNATILGEALKRTVTEEMYYSKLLKSTFY